MAAETARWGAWLSAKGGGVRVAAAEFAGSPWSRRQGQNARQRELAREVARTSDDVGARVPLDSRR
jgi:hypothetical protein